MNEQETSADIIAEMNQGNTCNMPFAYRIGRPDRIVEYRFNGGKKIKSRETVIENVTVEELAHRLEAAKEREQYQICSVITRLLMDSELLRKSDERNGKPYKLFGEPLTIAYGRLACQLYRAANIQRRFWLRFLKETHSDPKGIDKHLRRLFRDRRCQCPI